MYEYEGRLYDKPCFLCVFFCCERRSIGPDALPWKKSTAASRHQLHRLAWDSMQRAEVANKFAHIFRDMLLLVVVPQVEHTVATDHSCGGDFNIALREGLSFYDDDLKVDFDGEGRVLYSGSCHLAHHMAPAESVPTLLKGSVKHFFTE